MHALYVVEFCLPSACLWDEHMMMHHDVKMECKEAHLTHMRI